jgi:ABC-type branched-subunit amino acid transport system substrate-binding protein
MEAHRKLFAYFVVFGLWVFLFVPLSQGASKEFKVGCNLALSGDVGAVGIAFRNGGEMAADYFNGKGGLSIGQEKYAVELNRFAVVFL